MSNPITNSQSWTLLKDLASDPSNPKHAQFKAAFEDLEKQINHYMGLITDLQLKTEALEDQVQSIQDNMFDIQKELGHQKKMRLISECKALKNTFIAYGIECHPKAKLEKRDETNPETSEQFKKKMEEIKINMIELGSFDSYRLPAKERTGKDGNKYTSHGVKITLLNQRGKQLIYSALKMHGKNLKNFKIQQVIPRELIPTKQTLEKIARNLRNTVDNTQTRVSCRRGEISILTKGTNETKYTKIDRKILDNIIKYMIKKDADVFDEYEQDILGITQTKRKRADGSSSASKPSKKR